METSRSAIPDDAVLILPAAVGHMLCYALPLPYIRIHQPVHQLSHLALDLLRGIGHDLLLETLLHPAPVQEIHDPADAQSVVKKIVTTLFHLEEDAIDVGDSKLEVAHQVRLIHRELTLDLIERGEVLSEQGRALPDYFGMSIGQGSSNAERIEQLELDTARSVQRFADVSLQRLKAAGRPRRRLALLGSQREAGAHGKDVGAEPQQRSRALRDEAANLHYLRISIEDVDL